jgi:polygalacturonase
VTVKARGDGLADDTSAIQAAIDAAADRPGRGIFFLPAGR